MINTSYKFCQNRPINTCIIALVKDNPNAKPILAFLRNDIHISSMLLYLTTHYRPRLPSACR